MKKFIALAVLAGSTVSFAASDIFDIMYLPSAGTTYGFTTASLADSKVEFEGSGKLELDGYAITQTIGHSFTDRLSLQASINYTSLEADPSGDSKYDAQEGISDPTITARFRTMDEKFRWDIIGGATLGLMDKETEINSDGYLEDDNLQGGHSLFIGTQFGVKSENMQWAILGLLTHNLESESEYKFGGDKEKIESDAYNELLVRADILNKLGEKSFLRTHLAVNFVEGYDFETNEEASAPSTHYEIGTEYQHLFSKDLLARVGVDYRITNQQTGLIDEWKTWIFTIGANYQF